MKSRVISSVLLTCLLLVLFARFHMAIVRAFDPDEFAHLHWAWLIANGKLPYRDFFYYLTPPFQWILLPFFALPSSDRILLFIRMFQYGIYLVNVYILYRLARIITKHHLLSLMTILIFTTFPMTLDKTIDIRPDFLMLLPYIIAIERMFTWKTMTKKRYVCIGFLLGASAVILQKALPILPAALLLLIMQFSPRLSLLYFTGIGIVIPLGIFSAYLVATNLQHLAWQAFTHTQFVVNAGKHTFSLLATLSPWPLVYVSKGGVSFPWIVNMGIWIGALHGLAVSWKNYRHFSLFALIFGISAIVFLIFFPAPYVQYFIPLSMVASILGGLGLQKRPLLILLITIMLTTSFFIQYRERVALGATNTEQLQVIRDVLAITKPDEPIYDMVGSYVFRPDGYFICCHPFGEFISKLTTSPGSLRASLVMTKTKFLVMDRVGFVFWQTPEPDLSFLLSNYLPTKYNKIYSLGQQFRCQNGACVGPGATRSTNIFTILVPEKYTVILEPKTSSVTIDGKEIQNGHTLDLARGPHQFSASPATRNLRIQLDR